MNTDFLKEGDLFRFLTMARLEGGGRGFRLMASTADTPLISVLQVAGYRGALLHELEIGLVF